MNHLSNIFRFKTLSMLAVGVMFCCGVAHGYSATTAHIARAQGSSVKSIPCALRSGSGEWDTDILSIDTQHYLCDDNTSCEGYYVGAASGSIHKSGGFTTLGWGRWVKCDIGTFVDEWKNESNIKRCTKEEILAHNQGASLVLLNSYSNMNYGKPVIIKGNSILKSSVAVKSNQKGGYCVAYQCKTNTIANDDHSKCITPVVEDVVVTESPKKTETPARLTDASTQELAVTLLDADPCDTETGCVPTCVAGAETVGFRGGKCHAITCTNNFYLVKNAAGVSMGWCYGKICPTGQHVQTDERNMVLPPNVQCVEDEIATPSKVEAEESAEQDVPVTESVIEDTSIETTEEPDETGNNSTPGPSVDVKENITESVVPSGPADGESCEKPGAVSAEYRGGKCVAMKCSPGFEPDGDNCAKISGPCESLPDNATRGNRQYDADTESEKCIVDDCVDGYVVADDKLSCHEDYHALAEQAREREQSTGNKLLGAVGMGATGIGGSMLLSGMSETKSDEDAERAMKAYLETFSCKYGNASVPGGTKNVEIPGGNELIQMYAEYVALANDLKVRKEALGMKPGIESEAILDSATSGLYDDVSTGKTKGAYASLARALSDPNSEDAKLWAAQREETDEKKKTGAITAGTGAGASLVGNIISESVDKNKKK